MIPPSTVLILRAFRLVERWEWLCSSRHRACRAVELIVIWCLLRSFRDEAEGRSFMLSGSTVLAMLLTTLMEAFSTQVRSSSSNNIAQMLCYHHSPDERAHLTCFDLQSITWLLTESSVFSRVPCMCLCRSTIWWCPAMLSALW